VAFDPYMQKYAGADRLFIESRSKAHQERNRYLQKSASMTVSPDKSEPVKDLVNTGVIGLAGGVTNTLADRLLHGSKGASGGKAFAIGTGLGLVGDYGALRLNRYINRKIDDHVVAPK
jgi:hypothetical protein